MIVTIDGPAGAGKSSCAKGLAARLGFRFLDTGAMYRAVALAALQAGVPPDSDQVGTLVQQTEIRFVDDRVLLNGQDVSTRIRESDVTAATQFVADNPAVRERLVDLQRRVALDGNVVTEGRDQGTVAFPDAECKIYLTASAEERARRRTQQMADRGMPADYATILSEQNQRDDHDRSRAVGSLSKAADAIEVTTDGLSELEVIDQLEAVVRRAGVL